MKATAELRKFILANKESVGADAAFGKLMLLEARLTTLLELTEVDGDLADQGVHDYLLEVIGVKESKPAV